SARVRAVLLQDTSLRFAFTAFEVVSMGRSPHGRGSATAGDRAITAAALDAVGMSEHAARAYPTLSGGERQLVQLARVLGQIWERPAGGDRYLLLDEPTANLDLPHQHDVLRLTRQLAGAGVGILVILHDLNLAAAYADRVVVLRHGRVCAAGAPASVFTPET